MRLEQGQPVAAPLVQSRPPDAVTHKAVVRFLQLWRWLKPGAEGPLRSGVQSVVARGREVVTSNERGRVVFPITS